MLQEFHGMGILWEHRYVEHNCQINYHSWIQLTEVQILWEVAPIPYQVRSSAGAYEIPHHEASTC